METNAERRRQKLAALCAERGIREVAKRAGLNWQSLAQVIKKSLLPKRKDGTRSVKNLGDEAARKIESSENLGAGWFDSVTTNASSIRTYPNEKAPQAHANSAQAAIDSGAHSINSIEQSCNCIAGFMEHLSDTDREVAAGWLAGLARHPASTKHVIGALTDMVTANARESPSKQA